MSTTFYPEMGEVAPAGILFIGQTSKSGVMLKWKEGQHAEALATFRDLGARPMKPGPERLVYVSGPHKWDGWMCFVSFKSYDKLTEAGVAALEASVR
jgi:hypothetical protein